jgi:ubiquitin-conjugating enzyme E2 I
MSIAEKRLAEERKSWRKDHPFGFGLKPRGNFDGTTNLMVWDASIPGKVGTDWEGGVYGVTLEFSSDFPMKAPKCRFSPPIFHCNVLKSGAICLDIINAAWKPSNSLKELLIAIQLLLDEPNSAHVTDQPECSKLYNENRPAYRKKIRDQAAKYVPKT